jgi:hypothetical protein
MDDVVDIIRTALSNDILVVGDLNDDTGIADHIDTFVDLSRDNETVKFVTLFIPFTDRPGDDASGTHDRYAIWESIAEGIGNLQALCEIIIMLPIDEDDEEDTLAPDWEIWSCILRRLREGVRLRMGDDAPLLWHQEALQVFARVIHGHARITAFETGASFPFECLDVLCSALLTLPALTNVSFEQLDDAGPEEGQSLESMVKLLQSPVLREVTFQSIVLTNTLSQAVAKALKERSEITELHFTFCSFPEGGDAVIARALKTNTTLERLYFYNGADEGFYEVLAAAPQHNSTLQDLVLPIPGSCSWLSPLFLALRENTGLKELMFSGEVLSDAKLSTAMKLGLGKNSTLESLSLSRITACNDTCLWREALSFLRTNRALKKLFMGFDWNATESHVAAIRREVAAALCENESLESLSMIYKDAEFEDYLIFVAAIQPNTTLKKLWLHTMGFCLDEDETKRLSLVLEKNYGLEEIPGLNHGAGDIRSIFQLNRAGRCYLVQDGSSISKGVDVLSGVSNDINSVFLHLLENPRLCDRSAVEMSGSRISDHASS